MIDSSKTRKSLVGVEVQSLYVIERRSKISLKKGQLHVHVAFPML